MTYQNIFIIQPDGNGHRDGNNPTGAGGGFPPNPGEAGRSHAYVHSMIHYTGTPGPGEAPTSTYTSGLNWAAHYAQHDSRSFSSGGNFGQIINQNLDWINRPGPPTSININVVNNNPAYWDRGGFANEAIHTIFFMASNFEQFETTPNDYLARALELIDNNAAYYPYAQYKILVPTVEPNISGNYVDNANLAPSEFNNMDAYCAGPFWNWHVSWYWLIRAARPLIDLRIVPIGPLISDLRVNNAFMSTLGFTDFFGDDAPHGTEMYYSLVGWVLHHDIHGAGLNVVGLAPPAGAAAWPSAIANNLDDINQYLSTRKVDHYVNAQGEPL